MLLPRIHLFVACSVLLAACGTNPSITSPVSRTVPTSSLTPKAEASIQAAQAAKQASPVYVAQAEKQFSVQQYQAELRRREQAANAQRAKQEQERQHRRAELQRQQAEQQRLAESQRQQAEQQRIAEQERQRVEQARQQAAREAEAAREQQAYAARKHQLEQKKAQERREWEARRDQMERESRQRHAQQLAAQRQEQHQRQSQSSLAKIINPPKLQHYQPPVQQARNEPPPAIQLRPATSRMFTGDGKLTRLPDTIASALRLRGMPERNMSVYVRPASARGPALLTANADTARNPASTMKLVTTYSALGILGPDYRWPTELYINGAIRGGTLYGDVLLKGYGDPAFHENDFQQMLQALRARGIHHITGNLVVDTSFFKVPYQDPGAFDGKPKAAYNAQPEALLYQERGSCYEFTNLKGKIEKICPVSPRNAKARADLNVNIFGGFWKLWVGKLRGQMQGRLIRAQVPPNAELIYTHYSPALREVIVEINKDSNNVMARQLMLSVGAKQMGAPATPQKGAIAIGQWLESRGLSFPELRLENGSGLSRIERISARHLGEMLVDAYNSPYRQDFMNSLAILGVDGTLRNRMKKSPVTARGRFKTGTLRNVRGLAGYLTAADGQTYVISILHNDPRARSKARAAHDDMIEWVYWGSRNHFAGL